MLERKPFRIDSLDLARIALPRLKSHRLIDLVHAFDAPISTHRADADVEALCAVYRILLAAVSDMPNDLVEYISKLAPIEEWSTGAVFALIAAQQREHATSAAGEKAETFPFSLSAMRRGRFSQANQPKPASENASANEQSEDLPMEFPAAEEIEAAFSPNGLVGSLYNDFEPRDEQVVMAKEVLKAFLRVRIWWLKRARASASRWLTCCPPRLAPFVAARALVWLRKPMPCLTKSSIRNCRC